ncbi:hypothetical protein [Thiosulfatihalobacter marinus]|jgi:hypothetical protein|uniref:hypothetical protein n=1 Tax=Thiosulfatihalobacter marinus TaxID=2792481 RepID=UPI0018D8EFC7|nr:hypothetical protein [Thiosulfatihalobacter marinus]
MTSKLETKQVMIGAAAGIAVILVSAAVLGMSLLVSVVLGAIVYVAVSRLKRESGRATAEPEVMAPVAVPTHAPEAEPVVAADTPTPQPEVSASGSPAADQQAATGSAGADMAGDVRLGTLLPGETEVSERKGNWRYNG